MMQHKGSLDSRVSEKGWRMLDKIDREKANQEACIVKASRQYAAESGQEAHWYCLSVATGREHAVEKCMLEAGVEACVPMRMGAERKRRGNIIPPSREPVMTGYVMVRCVHSSYAMRALHDFEYVTGMVGGWDGHYHISDKNMSAFMQMAMDGVFDHSRPSQLFSDGAKVSIKAGPFAAFAGTVVGRMGKGKGDAVVELSIFGRTTPVIIPLALLDPM